MTTNTDVFNNSTDNYVYPSLTPCPDNTDTQTLIWTKNGLTIVKGSKEIYNLDFSDLSIPVNAFNNQEKIIQPGEVIFIQGLTKGLCFEQEGFDFPSLVSTNQSLNQFYMKIDCSISYYNNFSYNISNIDVSSNYGENADIAYALTYSMNNSGINVSSSYDPSILIFSGGAEGYDFHVSNVKLTLIDSSIDSSSPFPNNQNNVSYILTEDPSAKINPYRYANSAMQGVALKGIYPASNLILEDNWFYLNHVSDFITLYDSSSIAYNTDISTNTIISFNTLILTEPSIGFDASLIDVSLNNQTLTGLLSQGCYFTDCSINNSMFYLGTFNLCRIIDSSIGNNSVIIDSSISNSLIENSLINSSTNIDDSIIWDSSINNSSITDTSIYNSYIQNSLITGCTIYNCLYDSSTIFNNTIDILVDPSIACEYVLNYDSSTYYIKRIKKLDVGMSGYSTDSVLSAGDYLSWITANNKWNKVSEMYIWTSTTDPAGCDIKNLIDGFYVFNPHDFAIKINYIVFI